MWHFFVHVWKDWFGSTPTDDKQEEARINERMSEMVAENSGADDYSE